MQCWSTETRTPRGNIARWTTSHTFWWRSFSRRCPMAPPTLSLAMIESLTRCQIYSIWITEINSIFEYDIPIVVMWFRIINEMTSVVSFWLYSVLYYIEWFLLYKIKNILYQNIHVQYFRDVKKNIRDFRFELPEFKNICTILLSGSWDFKMIY